MPGIQFFNNRATSNEIVIVVRPTFHTDFSGTMTSDRCIDNGTLVLDSDQAELTNKMIVGILIMRLPLGPKYNVVYNTLGVFSELESDEQMNRPDHITDDIIIAIHIEPEISRTDVMYNANGIISETAHHLSAQRVMAGMDLTQRSVLCQIKKWLETKLGPELTGIIVAHQESEILSTYVSTVTVNCISSQLMSQVYWNEITAGEADIGGEGYMKHPMYTWNDKNKFDYDVREQSYRFTGRDWDIQKKRRSAYEEYQSTPMGHEDYYTWLTEIWDGL